MTAEKTDAVGMLAGKDFDRLCRSVRLTNGLVERHDFAISKKVQQSIGLPIRHGRCLASCQLPSEIDDLLGQIALKPIAHGWAVDSFAISAQIPARCSRQQVPHG